MKNSKPKPIVVSSCPICSGKRLIIRAEIDGNGTNGMPMIYCCDCRKYIGGLAGKVIRTD